jgi:hypothetical protein
MKFSFRRAALTGAALATAALAPIACSSKTPETEPVIGGCKGDLDCPANNYCENGACKPSCSEVNSNCPMGQVCSSGRCVNGSTGGTGGTGSGGTSGTGAGGTGLVIIDAGSDAPDDGALNPDAACASDSATASLVPVSMFVMFDRSGSMVQNMSTRWANATAALTAFFQDPGAADLAVALRFFPHDQPAVGCTNNGMTGCVAADCAQPLVPLMADPMVALPKLTADPAPTDALEQQLLDAITAALPTSNQAGGTPTSAALEGALSWASSYQALHPRPEQQTVVVFVTDGKPNGCDTNTTAIAAIAANALATSMVKTYVVGLTDVPQDLAFLQDLAVAGGTDTAFIVQDGATAAMNLVTTLKAIQGMSLDCSFPFPAPTDGGMANPAKINVNYTPSAPAGSAAVPFYRVDNEAACGTDAGWYYDNPMAPTTITLCPSSCEQVKADTNAKLDIQIGCDSRPPPEH